ncbi:MAG TPA: tetratricopeptide repeat protein [Thermoanaerobaculia bacterium]|nr:tetratricopeptide repeat protein [Thermoanaerobaculia bacterium]
MRRAVAMPALLLVMLGLGASGCRSARHHTPEATQENFGVNMARQNLWREARFRFQRAVDLKPDDAMAHNNLAVALEANGEFDKAAKEYREAMRLDKTNQYIQKNYSRFVEFTSRNKKRQQKASPAATSAKTASVPASADAKPAPPEAGAPLPAEVTPPTPPPVKPPGGQP